MIATIAANPEKYAGETITVEGVFQGWQVGDCQFPAGIASQPRTRADWLLRVDQACVYVTGGMPSGVNPMRTEDTGIAVKIEAKIRLDGQRQLYLQFIRSL